MDKNQLKITTDGILSIYEFLDEFELLSYETPKGFKMIVKGEFYQKTGESNEGVKNEKK